MHAQQGRTDRIVMAERRGFLLMAAAVGVIGVALGAYVMWGAITELTVQPVP